MEKFLNPYDKENMRKAVLRHEETFRDQVNELHRLYRTQKKLMKDLAAAQQHGSSNPGWNSGVLEGKDDQSADLELTLGSRSYYQRKIKAAEPGTGLSGFSTSSSSTGSISCLNKTKQGKQNQERLDSSHWVTFSRFLA